MRFKRLCTVRISVPFRDWGQCTSLKCHVLLESLIRKEHLSGKVRSHNH